MKKLKRIICALLSLSCCFSVACCMSACEEKKSADGENLFYVEYNDVRIELDKAAEDVLAKLGTAKYTENLGDCGGIGVQYKYTYNDIAVNTLKEKDGEKIHKISFMNDLVKTSKDICIGASEQSVRDAYGTPTSEEGGRLTYQKGDLKLEFKLKDAEVSAINYTRVR